MELWEAIKLLQEGKRIRRKSWAKNDYICLNKDVGLMDRVGRVVPTSVERILFANMSEPWEEYGWEETEEKARVVHQVRCPYCFTYSCREESDVHFIYCPHCGAKVVK